MSVSVSVLHPVHSGNAAQPKSHYRDMIEFAQCVTSLFSLTDKACNWPDLQNGGERRTGKAGVCAQDYAVRDRKSLTLQDVCM